MKHSTPKYKLPTTSRKRRGTDIIRKIRFIARESEKISFKSSPINGPREALQGTKRHLMTEANGMPLSVIVTGANRHDKTQTKNVLDNNVIEH
ncbi:MAG: transposase [bacterium]|nr:MAG: transposase [bacterium]